MAIRLSILEPRTIPDQIRYQAFKQAFGFYPDVMRGAFARTKLDLSPYRSFMRVWNLSSPAWSKGELELFISFVSAQNECNF